MRLLAVAFASALLLAGCASAPPQGGALASVRSPDGKPPAAVPPKGDLSSHIQKTRALSAAARPPLEGADSVEHRYPDLKRALDRASAVPTAGNLSAAGDAYLALGIRDQAYDRYLRASELDPSSAAAWDGMARIWRDWNLPRVALGDAVRAVYFAPTSAPAHNTLGSILQALDRGDLARAEFERALQLDPTAAYAANNLCYSWLSAGRGDVALAWCRRALALAPTMAPARNNLALAYGVLGDSKHAAEEFAAAGDAPSADFNLGILYMAGGKFDEAAAAFRRAAARAPGLPMVSERLEQARRLAVGGAGTEDEHGRR